MKKKKLHKCTSNYGMEYCEKWICEETIDGYLSYYEFFDDPTYHFVNFCPICGHESKEYKIRMKDKVAAKRV